MHFKEGKSMDEKIRACLTSIAKKNELGADEEILLEILMEGREIWTGNEEAHRHWIAFDKVVQIENKFFRYSWAKGAGDKGIFDAGWEFDPETIIEVMPVTKTITVIEYIPV